MNYKQEQIEKLKKLITEADLKQIIKYDLINDVWTSLKETGETIYSLGVSVYSDEFRSLTYAANSVEGLEISAKENQSKYHDRSLEESHYSLKWRSGNWKYFPFEDTTNFEELDSFSDEFTILLDDLEEFDDVYGEELSEEQYDQIMENQDKKLPDLPEYYEYDDIYEELMNLVKSEVIEALKEVKSIIDKDDIVVSVFGNNVSGQFLVDNCGLINPKNIANKMKEDLIQAHRY